MASRFARVRSYELMVIFHPELEDEAIADQVGQVQSYITDVDGTVTTVNRETPWGRRRLAYPIRHESRDLRDGIYVLFYFDVEAGRTVEIEREIKLNTRIVRHMLLQQTTPTMEPPAPAEEAAPGAEAGTTAATEASAGQTTDAGSDAPAGDAAADAPAAELSTVPDAAVQPDAPADPTPAEARAAAEETDAAPQPPVFDDAPAGSAPLEEADAAAEGARASDEEELNRPSTNP